MDAPQRIAFFGGTFDPIHEGHLDVAAKAVEALGLDRVIFIPCRRSPHKSKSPGASDEERLTMLKLATSELAWAVVDDYELKKPPPSYTWETMEFFQAKFPTESRRFLLIGFDQWESLPRWNNIENLARKIDFIVVGREEQPQPRSGYRAHFIDGNHPASASEIRSALASGKPPKWLPPAVEAYINEKDLYSPIR